MAVGVRLGDQDNIMAEIRLRIVPEFEERMINSFLDDISSTASAAVGGATPGGGGGVNVGVGAKGVAGIAGVGALAGGGVMAAVEMLIKEFQPLAKMVQQIVRMLMQFLRPVADFVMIVLDPIMSMLRPLLMIMNTVMAPYRQAAMQLSAEARGAMQEGDVGRSLALSGLSALTILRPISDMLFRVQAEGLKLLIDIIGTVTQLVITTFTAAMGSIASIFSDQVGNRIFALGGVAVGFVDQQGDNLKTSIDSAVAFVSNESNRAIEGMARSLGSDVILPVIAGDSPASLAGLFKASFAAFGEAALDVINTTFEPGTGFIGAFSYGMDRFGSVASDKIRQEMARLESAVNRAESAAQRASRFSDELRASRGESGSGGSGGITFENLFPALSAGSVSSRVLRSQSVLGGP